MKKLICLFLASLVALCSTGCTLNSNDTNTGPKDSVLETLCVHTVNSRMEVNFIRDTTTENIYIIYDGYYAGSLQPYYNKNGEIMKYDEFQKIHKHIEEEY